MIHFPFFDISVISVLFVILTNYPIIIEYFFGYFKEIFVEPGGIVWYHVKSKQP